MSSKPLEPKKRRNADYKLNAVSLPFSPGSPDLKVDTCANIQSDIGVKELYNKVSAPYALARLCALFKDLHIETCGQESYNVTWMVVLKHNETGHVVTLYDYKGAFSFGSDISGTKTPASFKRDVKALIKALLNDRCPHPYDGCAVGEVA